MLVASSIALSLSALEAGGALGVIGLVVSVATLAFRRLFERWGVGQDRLLAVWDSENNHHASLATASSSIAASVTELLQPLQEEVRQLRGETVILRREVEALRQALIDNGIPHPLGGPLHPPGPRPESLDLDGDS